MIASLDNRFDVHGVVELGTVSGSLRETANGDVDQLTMNDFLTVCSGTNDIDRNYLISVFNNITNFIKSVNHTNIILMCSLQT
jgi:hypothetical protein